MELLRKLFCKNCPLKKKNNYLESEIMRLLGENEVLKKDIHYLESKLIYNYLLLAKLSKRKTYIYKKPKDKIGGEDGRNKIK